MKDKKEYQNTGDRITQGGEEPARNKKSGRGTRRLEHWQLIALLLMVYDFAAVNLSYFLALWFRFDCKYSAIKKEYLLAWRHFIPIYSENVSASVQNSLP